MAASDNLSPRLFHGLSDPLGPRTRKIRAYRYTLDDLPGALPYKGKPLAFAAGSIPGALMYGYHIYEVEPPDDLMPGFGRDEFMSHKGFNIVRKLPAEEIDPHVPPAKRKMWGGRSLQEIYDYDWDA